MIEKERIISTLLELTAFDSPSGKEDDVANYTKQCLEEYGFEVKQDNEGNVIGFKNGEGEPILLNAHLDRVPPAKGHTPVIDGTVVKSDGTTNLGADDTAGITIILEAVRELSTNNTKHPPLVVAFTRREEIGLFGAKGLDVSEYGIAMGIVFDNAFEAGTIVSKGAAYIAFDAKIKGKSVHPGKNLEEGVNVISIFQKVDLPIGETDNGNTRVNIGIVNAGTARNQVPDELAMQGEIRSFLSDDELRKRTEAIQQGFENAANQSGGSVEFSSKQLAVAYSVDESEPLVQAYKSVVEKRGGIFKSEETFVASDANALRGEKGLKVFVISTGVINEHSYDEQVDLKDLELLTNDLVSLLSL